MAIIINTNPIKIKLDLGMIRVSWFDKYLLPFAVSPSSRSFSKDVCSVVIPPRVEGAGFVVVGACF